MQNILVTGGAGFIGSNFIRYLFRVEPDAHIFNLDALTYAGSLENLKNLPDPARHVFIKGDICDRALVENTIRQQRVDTIVHFAAETHVDRSILGPDLFMQTNVMGTFTLLEVARQLWIEEKSSGTTQPGAGVHFHHVSSDEVYGSLRPDDPPFSESTPYDPNSPYSASKAASDHIVRAYGHTYGLPYTITNCSNNYGPHQYPEKFIPLMIMNALQGDPLPLYGDGQQIRDWLYVEDHCEAIHTVIRNGAPAETYNIGGNNQPTNLVMAETLCDILDELIPDSPSVPHQSLIQFVSDRPGHDRRYAMDISKIKRDLDWQPRYTIESGLVKTVEWYLTNNDWINAIRKQGDYDGWLEKNYQERGADQ